MKSVYRVSTRVGSIGFQIGFAEDVELGLAGIRLVNPFRRHFFVSDRGLIECRAPWDGSLSGRHRLMVEMHPFEKWMAITVENLAAASRLCRESWIPLPPHGFNRLDEPS